MLNDAENYFDPQAKPVRRDSSVRETYDEEGQPKIESDNREFVTLSPEGSIDRVRIAVDTFHNCGCTRQKAQGGKCGEVGCNRISCVDCFGRCLTCYKPLCLEHSRFFVEDFQRIRTCDFCYRRKRRKTILRSLFGIFFKLEGDTK